METIVAVVALALAIVAASLIHLACKRADPVQAEMRRNIAAARRARFEMEVHRETIRRFLPPIWRGSNAP